MKHSAIDTLRVRLVLHPVVLLSLVVWLLNDHVLKASMPGLVTGTLSDIVGLVAFPVVLFGTLPSRVVERMGAPRAMVLCVASTALVFVLVNVEHACSDAMGVVFSLLPRLGDALSHARSPDFHTPSAHVADLADLAALPAVLVPLSLVRVRSLPPRALALMALLFVPTPSHAQSTSEERVWVEAHASAISGAATVHESTHDGDATYTLAGGRLSLAGEHRHLRFSLFGSFVQGWRTRVTDSYAQFGVTRTRRRGYAVGGTLGMSYRWIAGDVGLLGVRVATEVGRAVEQAPFLAFCRLTLGPRELVALSVQAGSTDGFLSDARMFDAGFFLERTRYTLRIAAGIGRLWLPDLASSPAWDEGTTLRARRSSGLDVLADVELHARLGAHVALELWLQVGTQLPRGSVGIGVEL